MRRTALPVLATVLLLAACGGDSTLTTHSGSAPTPSTTGSAATSSTTSSATQSLSVSPPAPTPTSRVTFAFPAPATAGHHGPSLLSFVLTLAGPRHAGCLGPRTAPIRHAVKGTTASVRLGGTWCTGAYLARVQEFARPFCKPGQMCAQYVRLIGTVAAARFRVAAP
jgi:hypothetical protein